MPPDAHISLPEHASFKDMTQQEVLEDLSSRFILNLPDEELESIERICFQVEQAHWYYEDFVREENRALPSLPLKKFSAMLFRACPMLRQWTHDHEVAFDNFMQYKTRVPVCGAIMLNDAMDKCILVKGWKSSSGWGFPKGKINEKEDPSDCAIREVLEETGYDLTDKLHREDNIKLTIREQAVTLFIVPGVPEDSVFQTRTRKEISKIEWWKLADLPTWKRNRTASSKFYLISPFIGLRDTVEQLSQTRREYDSRAQEMGSFGAPPLKDFITQRKTTSKSRRRRQQQQQAAAHEQDHEDPPLPVDAPASLIDNLFARITTSTPAPSSSEASSSDQDPGISEEGSASSPSTTRSSNDPPLSSSDPHFQRLLNSLVSSEGIPAASSRTSTPPSPGQNHTPLAPPNGRLQQTQAPASSASASSSQPSTSASQSPTDPIVNGELANKKRQKHLALLESVSEEIAHQATMATPQPPHAQLMPGPRPATTSPVRAFHPFHVPPAYMNMNGTAMPPPYHHPQQQLANGPGHPLLNGHGPLLTNGFAPNAMNGLPQPPHSAMAGPLPPSGFLNLNMNMNGNTRMMHVPPGLGGLPPISPAGMASFNVNGPGAPPPMLNGAPPPPLMVGRPPLAPLQSFAFNQARFGGPVPPLSAGATMPTMPMQHAPPPPQVHGVPSSQQQHLLALLNGGRVPMMPGQMQGPLAQPQMSQPQMQMQMQMPLQQPMIARPSTAAGPGPAPSMTASQVQLLNILNGGPRL